eukprot:CAMPEP_0174258762 /NCGR_PEP_ID=MMETSP0439-20130205/7698_1 /TAXON_ID=0 /ORGANISM="Stereomyxa ramosa, Strain Chinc5" /LENGTH=326 /DNA_ID=CAMNT_0015342389 /DNA_START=952 /DNA_END=1932 /DNA_ORIENTATION=-
MAMLSILAYGGTLVAEGELTVGLLTSFMLYSIYVGAALSGSAKFYSELNKGAGAAARVFQLYNREPSIPNSGGKTLENITGRISFKDVHFSYPTRPEEKIFENFNLDIEEGSTLALVGESGAGKSTIPALIARLYSIDSGKIELDGEDLSTLDPQWLRKNIGFVSQDVVLFAGSIAENIAYGMEDDKIDLEKVKRAATIANAHDFIRDFPDGYNTFIGERGITLSGGQRQRVAIARAILKDPKILILDEATSALDSKNERAVQNALEKLKEGRTTLVIAHRLSTIKNATKICVLDAGKVTETGSHDELISRGGLYKKLITQQVTFS